MVRNCPQAGKWAIAWWDGPDTDAEEGLDTCGEGAVDAAYALDPSSGEWLRRFRDRPEISNLSTFENMQGFFAFGSSTASPTAADEPAPPEPGQMYNCPQAGRWALAVWQGADTNADAALDTCGVWQADVAYSLDPETGGWTGWFRDRRELSTLSALPSFGAAVVRGGAETSNAIAFESYRNGNWDIYVMQPDTLVQTRITHDSAEERDIAWSPDHLKIAFFSSRYGGSEMMVMNANGTMQGLLWPDPATSGFDVAWSPDGIRLAFVSGRDGNSEIYVMNADGTQTRLTYNVAPDDPDTWWMGRDEDPAWSPDGTKIAFTSLRDGSLEIYVMNADGTGQHNLTKHGGDDSQPTWSLDGARIAFTSNRGGNDNIHWMNADGTGQVRLTTNQSGDYDPAWSP